jgi:PhnB protein
MLLNPYLHYNGQCEAAFTFYEKCLGGKIAFKITYGESPMAAQTPSEFRGKIMHIRLIVGDKILMGSDAPAGRYEEPQGFSVSLGIETPEEAERIFKALSEKGKVIMPMEETFWAHRFGMMVDQFGIPWMINCEKTS